MTDFTREDREKNAWRKRGGSGDIWVGQWVFKTQKYTIVFGSSVRFRTGRKLWCTSRAGLWENSCDLAATHESLPLPIGEHSGWDNSKEWPRTLETRKHLSQWLSLLQIPGILRPEDDEEDPRVKQGKCFWKVHLKHGTKTVAAQTK